jgi:diguanylate cyclase (GGDEF)-like protein
VWIGLIISTAVARRLSAKTRELEYQASHDTLTGLPNRLALLDGLKTAIDEARASGRSVALILMDLDRFKDINDTLGHDTGDNLIKQVADRLRLHLWDGDTVARLGGDEFGLALPISDTGHTELVVNKLRLLLAESFNVHDLSLTTDASIGVALFPAHASDAVSLMRCAETAMYRAKSMRRPYEIYDRANDPYSVERLSLTADVTRALTQAELFVVYQPKIEVATGRCTGTEALLRWRHPRHGLVPPDKFIPLAEQTSAIKDITHWTLNVAIAQCRAWHDTGDPLTVAVNLSATMLHDASLPERVSTLLQTHGLAPNFLQLEITETAIMLDPEGAFETLKKINELGVRLSIDDFGTGYSSLALLRKLPISEIKIDRSFVMTMLENENDATIVDTLIDLAHRINLRVVAEGVESDAVLAALASKNCDETQGYYFSRPLPAEDFAKWLIRAFPRELKTA